MAMRRFGFFRLRIDPIAAAVLLGLLVSEKLATVAALALAVAWHEAGHLSAARLLGIRVEEVEFGLLGARIRVSGILSYRAEGLLAAAGPAASFCGALLAAPFASTVFFGQVCALSLILGVLNLLPVRSFDGGRILYCLLAARGGEALFAPVLRCVSFAFLTLIWAFSVYLLLRAGSGVSWLGFSASLLFRFFEENRSAF